MKFKMLHFDKYDNTFEPKYVNENSLNTNFKCHNIIDNLNTNLKYHLITVRLKKL